MTDCDTKKSFNMDSEQKKLECPFTWELKKEWARDFDESEEPVIAFDEEPLLALISSIMITYIRTEKEDYDGAFVNLKATDEIWNKLDKSYLDAIDVSEKVLLHIKIATEYHVHNLAKRKAEADDFLKSLESSESFQSLLELATIDGCQSVAWSIFREKGYKKCINFARLALTRSPFSPTWYYIFGNGLRFYRKTFYGKSIPSDQEQYAIKQTCELSNKPLYKIRLAQMYRERAFKGDCSKFKDIYLELFSANQKSSSILLRLASVFMFVFNDNCKAKQCLDEAGKEKKDRMYHHYYGLYYSKKKEYQKAAEYFMIAGQLGRCYNSDLQFGLMLQKIDDTFNFTRYLKKMLTKHGQNLKYKQRIYMHMGMRAHFKRRDLGRSLSYFLQAIQIDPASPQLIDFFNITINSKIYDIYDFVRTSMKKYRLEIEEEDIELSSIERDMLKKLEYYCEWY